MSVNIYRYIFRDENLKSYNSSLSLQVNKREFDLIELIIEVGLW